MSFPTAIVKSAAYVGPGAVWRAPDGTRAVVLALRQYHTGAYDQVALRTEAGAEFELPIRFFLKTHTHVGRVQDFEASPGAITDMELTDRERAALGL